MHPILSFSASLERGLQVLPLYIARASHGLRVKSEELGLFFLKPIRKCGLYLDSDLNKLSKRNMTFLRICNFDLLIRYLKIIRLKFFCNSGIVIMLFKTFSFKNFSIF